MSGKIGLPVKIDRNGRVIRDPKIRAYKWRLNVPASITGTKKERLFFDSEGKAMAKRRSLADAHESIGDELLAKLKARGLSVTRALEYAIKHAPLISAVTVSELCRRFIESRRSANCKERYLANIKSQLSTFEDYFGKRLTDAVAKADIERFLADLTGKDGDSPASPKTQINFIITLTALFNFAVEEGWRGENPAAKIRRPKLDEVITSILSPEETAKLLEVAAKPKNADVFPAVLIQVFAGPRRSELPHITWEDINDAYLRLDKTKVRKKRAVELPPTLLAWLAPFDGMKGRIFAPADVEFKAKDTRNIEDAYTYRLSQLAEEAKISLLKNVLRHTAITYWDAWTEGLRGTPAWAGNSSGVIEQHYRGAATKADAESFYALKPTKETNVVKIGG